MSWGRTTVAGPASNGDLPGGPGKEAERRLVNVLATGSVDQASSVRTIFFAKRADIAFGFADRQAVAAVG
jgi:hypothetical protein